MTAWILLAAGLVPPAFLEAAYRPADRSLASLLIVAAAAVLWARGRWRVSRDVFSVCAAAMVVVSLASALGSAFPHSAALGFLSDIIGMILFLCFAGADHDDGVIWGWLALFFLLIPCAVPLFPGKASVWLNANILAGVLILLWPPASEAAGRLRGGLWIVLAAAGVLLFFRDSWPALLVFAVQAGVMAYVRARGSIRLNGILAAGAVIAVAGAMVAVPFLDADRAAWWRAAWAMFRSSPLLGVGPEGFGEAFPGFRLEAARLNTLFAHGFIFENLAEKGAVGLAVLAVLFFFLMRRGTRKALESPSASLGTGLAGFAAYNMMNAGFSLPGPAWLFWAQAGLWIALTRDELAPAAARGRKWVPLLWLGAAAAPALLIGRGAWWLDEARDAVAPSERESAADMGLRWTPWEPEFFSLRSAAKAERGDLIGAAEDAARAIRLSPFTARFQAEAGEIAFRSGRREEALRRYEEAVRLLPLNKQYRKRLKELRHGG